MCIKYCVKCGNEIEEDFVFCPECGGCLHWDGDLCECSNCNYSEED